MKVPGAGAQGAQVSVATVTREGDGIFQIHGSVQNCGNSSADALELPQSCTKPLNSFWPEIVGLLLGV